MKKLRFIILFFIIFLSGCNHEHQKPSEQQFAGKKILYINSYHEGYSWSDGIESALKQEISMTKADLKVIHLDTKWKRSENEKKQAGLMAKQIIEDYQPDIVIASDDNAAKYVIVPYYKDVDLPFVFCGINWDVSAYQFPYTNVTGMIEVEAVQSLVNELARYAEGERLGYLGLDALTEHKKVEYSELHMQRHFDKTYFVNSFEEWKTAFIKMQTEVDMLILGVQASLAHWDDAEAKAFVMKNTTIPTGASYDWMMDYALIGIIKVPEEHGRWSAKTAFNILDGIAASNIPIVHSTEHRILVNQQLATKLDIQFSQELLDLVNHFQ